MGPAAAWPSGLGYEAPPLSWEVRRQGCLPLCPLQVQGPVTTTRPALRFLAVETGTKIQTGGRNSERSIRVFSPPVILPGGEASTVTLLLLMMSQRYA